MKLVQWIGLPFLVFSNLAEAVSKNITVVSWGDHYDLSKFPGIMTLMKQQETDTIRLFAGDVFYPSTLSKQDGARHRVAILNDFNLTAAILGNHDLDGGTENAKERISESHFPWLAANALDREGNYYTGEQQTILLDINGIRVGIFGLISENTPELVMLDNNITFAPIIPTAKRMIKELKQHGAQIILAGTHMDSSDDEKLAIEAPEIHAIFGGHDHSKLAKLIGNTLLIKAEQEGRYLSKVTLEINEDSATLQVNPSWEFISNQNVQGDNLLLEKIDEYEKAEIWKLHPIARIDQYYDTLEVNLRLGQSAFASMIAASLQEYGNADLGFLFGGCIRNAHVYQKGDLFTYKDAEKELPFRDKFAMIETSGQMLLEALENGVSKMPEKDGRFPQLSGMVYSFDVTRPVGSRIIPGSVYVQGNPLLLDKMYKVATSNIIVDGVVGGYSMFRHAKILVPYSEDLLIVDVFANYIKNVPSMKLVPEVQDTCDIVDITSPALQCHTVSRNSLFFENQRNEKHEPRRLHLNAQYMRSKSEP